MTARPPDLTEMTRPPDLTEMTKILAKREMELLRFWNLTNDVLVILKKQGDQVTIDRVSPSVAEVLGWTSEELTDRGVENVILEGQPPFPVEGVRGLKNKWKSKPGCGLPEEVELTWTSSPWIASGDEERCYAVARPVLSELYNTTPRRAVQRRWTAMHDSVLPIDEDSQKRK